MKNLQLQFVLAFLAGRINRSQQNVVEYLKTENQIYRQQLKDKRIRFTDDQRRRLAAKAKTLGRKALSELDCIVTPDTSLQRYRKLIAAKYDGSNNREPGRPRSNKEIETLVIQITEENSYWGYTRIVGALKDLGLCISRTMVKRILKENGIEPAPVRRKGMTWTTFIKAHMGEIVAADFFTVVLSDPIWNIITVNARIRD